MIAVPAQEMKFKLDENIPVEASALLQEAAPLMTVVDQNMGGDEDMQIIQVCSREQSVNHTGPGLCRYQHVSTFKISRHIGSESNASRA
ncbi:MAG: DUF5615 family PIN-like protein [Anaerolineales bacterium]